MARWRIRLIVCVCLAVTMSHAGRSSAWESDALLEALEEQAFRQATVLAAPSLVRIRTVGGIDRVGRRLTSTAPTTGVILSADGYIISSAFNFISKPTSILVELADRRRLAAQVIASDRSRMLTLLKVDARDLVPIPAPSDEAANVRVGQWAIAMGRTYESRSPSVSVGIVSAVNRIWGKAIQTDAKVSPVNYGGPLIDIAGNVIGILVPLSPDKSSESAGVEWYDSGIGFAIPTRDVLTAFERLKSGQDLLPGLMGIELRRGALGADPVIERIRVGSPADKAGFRKGDLITSIDGQPVGRQADVRHRLGTKYADDTIQLTVTRDQQSISQPLTLVAKLAPYEPSFLGILPERLAHDAEALAGVGIRYVYPDSPAAKAEFQVRDRIIRVDDSEVNDAASLSQLLSHILPNDSVTIDFLRDGGEHTAVITLASMPGTVPAILHSAAIAPSTTEIPAANRPKTGRITADLPGHERGYWAYVPEDYNPQYRYGLMVWIHPNGDTMEATVLKEWKLVCDQRGLLILAPKAKDLAGWNLGDAGFIKDAIDEFTNRYSIDEARIFLHTHSSGGDFAFPLAFKFRETFRGIAATAAPLRFRAPANEPDFRLQFHLVCGDQDESFDAVRATADGLRKMKYPVSLTPIEDHGHKYPPHEQIREIGRWADCLDRI